MHAHHNYVTYSWRYKVIHTFLKDISPKANIIAWLEFKFAYHDVTVQHISHKTMVTSHLKKKKKSCAAHTDFPNSLSPSISIVHRFQRVF